MAFLNVGLLNIILSLWSAYYLSLWGHSLLVSGSQTHLLLPWNLGGTGFGIPDAGLMSSQIHEARCFCQEYSMERTPQCFQTVVYVIEHKAIYAYSAHCCKWEGAILDQQQLAMIPPTAGSIWLCKGISISIPLALSGHADWETLVEEITLVEGCGDLNSSPVYCCASSVVLGK